MAVSYVIRGLALPGRHALSHARSLRVAVIGSLISGIVVPIVVIADQRSASATAPSTYTPGTAQLATITNGAASAPWNEWQGDPATAAYGSVSPGTVLPTYTPGGAHTGSGSTAEPNVSVMPGASSGTAGNSPYPSGTVGTPGPLDGYCGTGSQVTESAGSPARQPAGTTLPLAPAYFPHITRNADGSLTGLFDYRPKDADEAVEVARSTDGGKDWTYEGEALEQNPNYCPSDDVNDDGNGHPFVLTVNGVSRLYTLQRAAGDTIGVGMLAHTLAPTAANPLNGAPATEKVGIDPDAFVPAGDGVTVAHTGGTTITLTTTGTAGSTQQLIAGGFVDLTQTPTPTASSVITCTGVVSSTLTGCTAANPSGETVAAGDLIEQVIGYVSGSPAIPVGPNNSIGSGGIATINVVAAPGGAAGFTNAITGTTYNNNAPNRAYIDGIAVYCDQSNANPTTKMEDCTTGPGGTAFTVASGDPITADPIIPVTAAMTSGLVAPDGIVGVLPSYPGAPSGATIVMYTEKILNYYVAGTTTNSSSTTFGSSIAFTPSSFVSQDLPAVISTASPVVVEIGDTTNSTIIPVTCTGLTVSTTDTLTGCSVPTADAGTKYSSTSLIGAPGAAVVPAATLAQTGEGSTSTAKLFKNNEDLAVVRVAYTTDGLNFSTTGLANGGVISGASNGASNYTDLSNPSTTTSPANLNAYAAPGTADAIEMRWPGSAGSIITNPDGSYGMFLSGAWAADGDSDAFNQIYYSSSTDGENWTIPTTVVSTDYTFSASVAQDTTLAGGSDQPLGISAYYSGRAYGPSVVQNPDGTLTMLFAGYRLPKTIAAAGTVQGTNNSAQYTVGATDPTAYRNILTETLTSATSPTVTTAVGMTASPAAPVVGQPVTYTATVSVPAPGTGNPTGTVTFTDSAGTLCSAVSLSLSSPDTASCTTTYSAVQTDTVTASYSGDSNYATSSGTLGQPIAQAATTTTVTTNPSTATDAQTVTLQATVAAAAPGAGNPTGSVTFVSDGSTLCSAITLVAGVASCAATTFGAGTHSVTASYTGDANFAASTSAPLSVPITKAATATSVVANPTSPVVGQPVTYTATVSVVGGHGVPTGTVSFTGNAGALCPAAALSTVEPTTATCTVTYSSAQSDSLTAAWAGDANYLGSSGQLTEPVAPAATTTTNLAAPTSVVVGQPVTFTATVAVNSPGSGPAAGVVTFTGNAGPLCTAVALSGHSPDTATCTVRYATAQNDTVVAAYAGDSDFLGSSGSATLSIAKSATTTSLTSDPISPVIDQPVTYTATVTAAAPGAGIPGGGVVFSGNNGTLCANVSLSDTSPDTAQCTVTYTSAQTDSVAANYTGDANYAASTSGAQQISISPIATTTTVAGPSAVIVGQPVTFTATVAQNGPGAAGAPTGSVSFTDSGVPISACTSLELPSSAPFQVSCPATQSALGSATIAASYSGDNDFAGSSASETVTSSYGPVTSITLSPTTSSITGGSMQTYVVTGQDAYGNSLGDVTTSATFSISPDGTCTAANCTAAIPGTHQVSAVVQAASASATLTVTPGPAVSPVNDVVGIGDDLSQYGMDFVADGDSVGDLGVNSAGNNQRLISIDATADANGRTAYAEGSTTADPADLDPTVVLVPGTNPVQRPDGSLAGIAALLADDGHSEEIEYVRSSQLPTAADQAAAGANGWGALHVIRIATDTLQIATVAESHAPAGLSVAELVKIYDGTYRRWGDIPGYTGSAPSALIEPLLPAAGTDTRLLFDADLTAANGGTAVVYGSDVLTVGDNDYGAILGDPSPVDAIDPFSAGQLSLIGHRYFGSDVASTVVGLNGTAPDGATSYDPTHPLYVILRDSDIASTADWIESTRNWAHVLFVGSHNYVSSGATPALLGAAGLTPSYADLGDISQ